MKTNKNGKNPTNRLAVEPPHHLHLAQPLRYEVALQRGAKVNNESSRMKKTKKDDK